MGKKEFIIVLLCGVLIGFYCISIIGTIGVLI